MNGRRPIAHPLVTVDTVSKLDAATRAGLPDRAFAYVDERGRRRLPIHDAAHVRNALARFGQVDFDSDEARQQARDRLLRAAQKHRIVPVGFITGELRAERRRRPGRAGRPMPSGFVTMLLTDIESSTALVEPARRRLRRGAGRRADGASSGGRRGRRSHRRGAGRRLVLGLRVPGRRAGRRPLRATPARHPPLRPAASRSPFAWASTAVIRPSARTTTSAWPCTPRRGCVRPVTAARWSSRATPGRR